MKGGLRGTGLKTDHRSDDDGLTGVSLLNTLRLIERHGGHSMLANEKWAEVGRLQGGDNGVSGQSPTSHWSLLKLNPQKQNHYMDLLDQHCQGVQSYFPVYRKLSRPHGYRKAVEITRPVYPGYVFLLIGDSDLRAPVSLPISARWVKFGGKIEAIPGFVINRLRTLESANELVKEVKYVNPYVRGVRVRVHLEVQDIMAVVVRLVGHNRCIVDTPLGRATVGVHTLQVL